MEEIIKLRKKCLFVNMLIVTLIIVCAFVAIGLLMTHRLRMDVIDALHRVIVQDSMDEFLSSDDDPNLRLPYFVISVKNIENNDPYIEIIGGKFYSLTDEELQEIVDEVIHNKEEEGILQTVKMRYLQMKMPDELRIACIDFSFERHVIDNTALTLFCIGIFVWIVFFILCIFFSYWIVKPVENAWKQQRQFIADASHELKTPVTVIAANAELLETEKQVLSNDGRRWLENITDESKDMKTLVEDLLNTARVDDQHKLAMSKIDLSKIITECALEFDAVFYQEHKNLQYDIAGNVYIDGNESGIRQLMKILLDNAVKYSSEHGETIIELHREKHNRILLVVASQGDEIPKEKRKAIFQRFYRLNEARDDHKGYGIGLSIAKQIIISHKGKIYVESIDRWNRFCVQLIMK